MAKHNKSNHTNTSSYSHEVSTNEINDYFQFLHDADERFKQYYTDFPDIFRDFAGTPKFKQLKMILSEKRCPKDKYSRNYLYSSQRVVVGMLKYLEERVSFPVKKIHISEVECVKDWHEAFEVLLSETSNHSSEDKIALRDKIKKCRFH